MIKKIEIPTPEISTCPECGGKPIPIAHNTGDGWFFGWECKNRCEPKEWEEGMVGYWPTDKETISSKELEQIGFKIV